MGRSKIIYGGEVLMDLTADTVASGSLLFGVTAHDRTGELVTGSCTYDVDSGDATVGADEILVTKTAYARGAKIVGTMANNGGVQKQISKVGDKAMIPIGYHDGSGYVELDPDEVSKLVPSNIRQGITVFNVTGSMSGLEDVKATSKEIAPSTKQQIVVPGDGFNYLTQVTVKAIPYKETENSAGGITVTIG